MIPPAALPITEAQLQRAIVGAARVHRYRVAHFRPARTTRGYRTAVEGDEGFVDLVLARPGVVFAWELKGWQGVKRPKLGRPTPAQVAWVEALAGGVTDARVLYPADLDDALLAIELGAWPGPPASCPACTTRCRTCPVPS